MSDNPIFTQLVKEFGGRVGKWVYTVKPDYTINILSETTRGIEPFYSGYYMRTVRFECTGDDCLVCQFYEH